jgi:hypothetical protein
MPAAGDLRMATQAEATAAIGGTAKKRRSSTPFGASIPIAAIGLIATLVGFLPTFFLRLDKVDVIHLAHGWTMIGWITLFLTQALFIRTRQYRWHRLLGWTSLALFVAMVASSWRVLALMLSGKSGLPFEAAKFFGYSDIVDMPLMISFFAAAIYWRRDRQLHARLMCVTVLTSIVPALARMFNILIWRSFAGLYHAMHPTYLLILGVLAAAILADRNNGRLRWPLPLAFGWFAIVYATQWPMMSAQWYTSFARAVGTLG